MRMGEVITCTRCKQPKSRDAFNWRISGNLHSWCKECKREYDRSPDARLKRRVHAPKPPRAAGAEEMSQWQPIDTAPKDGTAVLVTAFKYADPRHGRFQAVAFYQRDQWMTEQCPIHPPTHWMPLPEPPK